MLKKIGLLALCSASVFAMHSVELNINDKDLEFGAKVDMGQFNDTIDPDSVFIGAKILHADEKNSDFRSNSEMNDYYEASFLMQRRVAATELVIGLGVKLNGTKNFSSIPLGVEATYKIVNGAIPLYLKGAVYFAPEILSMQNAKNFLEYRVALDIELITNGYVTVGYRSLDTNYDSKKGGDKNYNKSAYIGVKFAF
ncbi:MAG: YfaZ family outer membrane protein [Sulfurimonas sp.]|uniref:YfaZ family outer membrane protein n=1 Tax=Sulfurimonas sp. TaxID=2022749 RepID=UPI0025CE3BAB|nr:YfaZ family outer membrane protein [Sulfurimonas sp.]MCK9492360.1 YfaZ family outer membrane protein [Sulfurimonas sp.]